MAESVVDRLHSDFRDIVKELGSAELSLRTTVEEIFQKSLLLAAASYFEKRLTEGLLEFMNSASGGVNLVTEFVRNTAIERRYHSFFDWNARNANKFYGLFGEDYRIYMTALVAGDEPYRDAILAFLELGRDRNRLVHQDFGSFPIEKTTEEIFELYTKALPFVENLTSHLESYTRSIS